jgi:phage gp29-like protein
MSTSFGQSIAQMLMAIFDGFAAFEQVFHIPKSGPLAGKITLRKLAHRPAETVTFLVDDNGGFSGLRQRIQFKGETKDLFIPQERSLYYAANEEERQFYGVSYFQSAFYHYSHKVKLLYLAHLAAQHRAVGTRYGKVPPNASKTDLAAFKNMLADFGFSQAGIMPAGFEVETIYPGASANFLELMNYHNSQMSKSVLAPFFDDSQGGPQSLVDFGKQSDAMFLMMLQTIMDDIANIINNYLIPKFVDWNFKSDKYPTFKWGAFTDEQKEMINTTFSTLATSGPSMNASKDFFLEIEKKLAEELGLEVDYKKVEADMKAAAEAQAQQFGQQTNDFNSFVSDVNAATGQQFGLPQDNYPTEQVDEFGNPIDPNSVPTNQTLAPPNQPPANG